MVVELLLPTQVNAILVLSNHVSHCGVSVCLLLVFSVGVCCRHMLFQSVDDNMTMPPATTRNHALCCCFSASSHQSRGTHLCSCPILSKLRTVTLGILPMVPASILSDNALHTFDQSLTLHRSVPGCLCRIYKPKLGTVTCAFLSLLAHALSFSS